MTLPNWEASSPMPTPNTARPIAKPTRLSSTSMVDKRTTVPIDSVTSPSCATRFGERLAAARGPASAATNIITDMGISRLPVSKALSPSTT